MNFRRYVLAGSLLMSGAVWLGARSRGDDVPATNVAAPVPQAIHHADPNHLWNRLHAALLARVGPDGETYGYDRLEPLLWTDSDHLTSGPSADRQSSVLTEFLKPGGDAAIDDPLRRAVLQRDLLQVANWMARQETDLPAQLPLAARAIARLAATPEQIAALPDNYAAATRSGKFARVFDPDHPTRPYLPPDLFDPDGPWVCVGRTDGLTAPVHISGNTFPTSVFLTFLKLPAGRQAGLKFVQELRQQNKPLLLPNIDRDTGRTGDPTINSDIPPLPQGTELALIRRAMMVDASRRLVASPLTESVQIRVLRIDPNHAPSELVFPASRNDLDLAQMAVFELQLRRKPLFAGQAGGLVDTSETPDFKTGFATHGIDVFAWRDADGNPPADFKASAQNFYGRYSCVACHRSPTIYGTMAFQRFVSREEVLGKTSPPVFPIAATTAAEVEKTAVRWMTDQKSWAAVRKAME